MGVSVHDDVGSGKRFMQVGGRRRAELVAVRHYDVEAVELNGRDIRELGPQLGAVHVAVHRRHGRQGLQIEQDFPRPHIAPWRM